MCRFSAAPALSRESFDVALVRGGGGGRRRVLAGDASNSFGKRCEKSRMCRAASRPTATGRKAGGDFRASRAGGGRPGRPVPGPRNAAAAPAEAGARIGAGATTTEAPDFYRPGVVYMACGAGGYTGLVRLEDGRLDVAAAFDAACGARRRRSGRGRRASAARSRLAARRMGWRNCPGAVRRP